MSLEIFSNLLADNPPALPVKTPCAKTCQIDFAKKLMLMPDTSPFIKLFMI